MLPFQDYSAAVFDLDGTLLDTLRDIAEAANRTLEKHGFPSHPQDAYRMFIGDGPSVLFERAIQATSPDDPRLLDLVSTYKKEAATQDDRHTNAYGGISQLLDTLNQNQIPLTILTNKRQPHAELCIKRFLGDWPWQIILGSGPHIPKKPDPKGALQIAATLNTSPEQCLYLGDTDVDMWTAKRAGMTAVGVLWGFREQTELEQAGADLIISHPSELIP